MPSLSPSAPRPQNITASTDSAGQFSVNVQAGDWDIFAYRDGFAPACTVVAVQSGEMKQIELRFPTFAPQRMVK